MSTFGGPPRSPTQTTPGQHAPPQETTPAQQATVPVARDSPTPPRVGRDRAASSRPASMIGGYQPPLMDTQDTLPELSPIFGFLNSHSNKLYQEGYFLKLNDLDTGRCIWGRRSAGTDTLCRGQTVRRSLVDRMLRPACGHGALPLGCGSSRLCGPRWRGGAYIYQPFRCNDQDGMLGSLKQH